MQVSGCDDLIADKIYTENFKLVLNQRIEDIYDEIMKMPAHSRESSSTHEESKLAIESAEEGSSLDSQLLMEFNLPLYQLDSLRNLRPQLLKQTVHVRFSGMLHSQDLHKQEFEISGNELVNRVQGRV